MADPIPSYPFGAINTNGRDSDLSGLALVGLDRTERVIAPDFTTITKFEQAVAAFYGAPYAVSTDSCTHALELCLRHMGNDVIACPVRTYVSVPMLAKKLNINLLWREKEWKDHYYITDEIIDAAVFWKRDGYIPGTFMCLSFQYQKHLSLGRGGMILCDNAEDAEALKRMSYDGREPGIPWREQNISTWGAHYYMTPELAALGLDKLQAAIDTVPRQWVFTDWPVLTEMDVFKNKEI